MVTYDGIQDNYIEIVDTSLFTIIIKLVSQ